MMIAICDDEKVFREELKGIIIDFKKKRRTHIDVYEFASGEALLRSDLVFDMVFLDFQMPGMDGMKTAKILRNKNIVCKIVFVTNYPQFVFDSFEVSPYRFFPKPLDIDKLFSMLDSFVIELRDLSPITVIADHEQVTIKAQDIVYLEAAGKYCTIRTLYKTYTSSKTLGEVFEKMPQHCFYRTHRSFAVNLYCVETIGTDYALLSNEEKVSVSQDNHAPFKRAYAEFLNNYFVRT